MTDNSARTTSAYVGRFAPSPSGPLHLGSIVAAMASYLDARAHQGRWLIRVEDLDPPREVAGAAKRILQTLQDLAMIADGPILWQSQRNQAYQLALDQLSRSGLAYTCRCSRRQIAEFNAQNHPNRLPSFYPGTCRAAQVPVNEMRSIRLLTETDAANPTTIRWRDRPAGFQMGQWQDDRLSESTGDFPIKRQDGLWSYQLAVVVDDHDGGITDVVRGADLIDSTARQIFLQHALQYAQPRYLHIPVVMTVDGQQKLSKQTGAAGVDTSGRESDRIILLNHAIKHLQLLPVKSKTLSDFWQRATQQWKASVWFK